jgi:selenocysteine lyase/cysteine desulfurase
MSQTERERERESGPASGFVHDDFEGIQQRLAAKRIYLSVRGDYLRIAPHLQVNDDDIDRLILALADVL